LLITLDIQNKNIFVSLSSDITIKDEKLIKKVKKIQQVLNKVDLKNGIL